MAALGIGAFIVALILVIVIHEAAHFAVARAFGIKVQEFFVGFGPKIWSRMRGETEVGVKAIPAGGYVKIAGMDPFETIPPEDLPRTFGAKPIWQRALVIVAGPTTHFVLAFVCFALWLGFVGQPVAHGVVVPQVERAFGGAPSPAAQAGLQPGDVIVRVGNLENPDSDALQAYSRSHAGEPARYTILRDGKAFEVTMTPRLAGPPGEEIGRIGVFVSARRIERVTEGPVGSITGGAELVGENMVGTVRGVTGSSVQPGSDACSTWCSPTPSDSRPIPPASSVSD